MFKTIAATALITFAILAAGQPAGDQLERQGERLYLQPLGLPKRRGRPALRGADVHPDRLIIETEDPDARMRAEIVAQNRILDPGTLEEHR